MSRDDLVLRPTLGADLQATATRRAGDAGKMGRVGSLLDRVRDRVERRRGVASTVRAAAIRGSIAVARYGARGAAAFATRGVSAVAARGAATLPGLILAALVVGGFAAVRLGTGQPLEGLGAQINRIVLGDADDEARARMATRDQMTGDSQLARIAGQEGQVNGQMRRLFDDLYKLNRRQEVGATLLREAFPTNSTLDLWILAAAEALKRSWAAAGGPYALGRLCARYQEARTSTGKQGGR